MLWSYIFHTMKYGNFHKILPKETRVNRRARVQAGNEWAARAQYTMGREKGWFCAFLGIKSYHSAGDLGLGSKWAMIAAKIRPCFFCVVLVPISEMHTAVSRRVVRLNRTRIYQKVLWVIGARGPWLRLRVFERQRETAETDVSMPFLFLLVNTVNFNQSTSNSFYP